MSAVGASGDESARTGHQEPGSDLAVLQAVTTVGPPSPERDAELPMRPMPMPDPGRTYWG